MQKEKPVTFSEFKLALRNFEETEIQGDRPRSSNDNSIMKTKVNDARLGTRPTGKCFLCGEFGYKKYKRSNKNIGNKSKDYQQKRW